MQCRIMNLYAWYKNMDHDQISKDVAHFCQKHGEHPNLLLVHPDNIDPKENKLPQYCLGGKQIKLTPDETQGKASYTLGVKG